MATPFIDTTVILFVFIFTFLFDLIDLQPQIETFDFVISKAYVVYYLIRVVFATTASIILQTTGLLPNPILLAFVSVIASVTMLYNFSLKLGGKNIADLPSLFETYKKKMIDNQLARKTRKISREATELTFDLSKKLGENDLETNAFVCLNSAQRGNINLTKEKIETLKQQAGTDVEKRKLLLAQEIVDVDPEYAKKLIKDK